MGKDVLIFKAPSKGLRRKRSRLSQIRRGSDVDYAKRSAVAIAARKPRILEQHLQTFCAMVRSPCVGRYASTFCGRPRYGERIAG